MFGVYIHFPYCRKRCPYCDFAVHARKEIPHDRYAEAVVAELKLRAPLFEGRQAVSIYFGGGTPALWRPDCIARVIEEVRGTFTTKDAEITVEANPDDLSREQLDGLRAAGVNRLSIGVQSLKASHLQVLGRLHGADESRAAMKHARAAGFENISLDLMYALPDQNMAELDRDLDGLLAMAPEHLSIYSLTVEERTAFFALKRAGKLTTPDNELSADMFERVRDRMEAAGFQHYEISAYARPGHRAVHNQLYWTSGEYLGLGCSAHSHRRENGKGWRFSNLRSVDRYLPALAKSAGTLQDPLVDTLEELDKAALEREALWLGLRVIDGIDRVQFASLYGADPAVRFSGAIDKLASAGLVEVSERIRLTRRGVLLADEVGAMIL